MVDVRKRPPVPRQRSQPGFLLKTALEGYGGDIVRIIT